MHTPKVKKGQPFVYIALLAVVLGSMFALKNCSSKDVAVEAQDENAVKVAIEYSPLSCYTYDDTLGGFSYDLLRLIAKRGKIKMEFSPMVTLSTTLQGLKEGKYDIVAAEFPVTKESREEYLFSEPVYLDREVLVQRKEADGSLKIKSQLELAKKTVYVIKDSPMKLRLANLSKEIGDTIIVKNEELYGPEQLFIMVATGEIDYAVLNESLAKQMAEKYQNVDVSRGISFTQFQSWVVKKGNEALVDSINKWLNEEKNSEEYKRLYERYFKAKSAKE